MGAPCAQTRLELAIANSSLWWYLRRMLFDFHCHTFLSDGSLSPVELVRRASVNGYGAVAMADHVGIGNCASVLAQVKRECELVNKHWNILALPGVEITHVPAAAINDIAQEARELGASVVVVHGETVTEPVEPGTNMAAVRSPHVDILAHPGLIDDATAEAAAASRVFLEISGRKGHSLTNGHVRLMGSRYGAKFLVNSDTHDPEDLLSEEFARAVALGCGFAEEQLPQVLQDNPLLLLLRVGAQLRASAPPGE